MANNYSHLPEFERLELAREFVLELHYSSLGEVSFLDGKAVIFIFCLNKNETLRWNANLKRFNGMYWKQAAVRTIKDKGVDGLLAVRDAWKGNLFSAMKHFGKVVFGAPEREDRAVRLDRLKKEDPDLYQYELFEFAFREKAADSYRHVIDIMKYNQRGPILARDTLIDGRQIFYFKLSR